MFSVNPSTQKQSWQVIEFEYSLVYILSSKIANIGKLMKPGEKMKVGEDAIV